RHLPRGGPAPGCHPGGGRRVRGRHRRRRRRPRRKVRVRRRRRPARPGRRPPGQRRRRRRRRPRGAPVTRDSLPVEPWCLREQGFDVDTLGQVESLFALSNGHLGLRGNLDEGEPVAQQGTYLSGYFEEHALPYAEGGYGYPESGQTIVNVTNGKLIRLLVDDEPFDMRYGQVVSHERVLDFRAGTLHRETEWISPAGRRIIVRSTRMVSFTHRAVAAIAYEVEPVDGPARLIVQSQLVANEEPPEVDGRDPRVAAALRDPLAAVGQDVEDDGVILLHRTRTTDLTMA